MPPTPRSRTAATVEAVEADLATIEGVDQLLAAAARRPVDALLANAGRGLGKAFLDQDFGEVRRVIDTNVTGTVYLSEGRRARCAGAARAASSSPARSPASCRAPIRPSTTAPRHSSISFSFALRAELKDTGVTVTCLMPGATETEFFERADMLDTKVGQAKKDDPADVAEGRLQGDDEGRRRRGQRLAEQAARGHGQYPAGRRHRRAAPQDGGARVGLQEVTSSSFPIPVRWAWTTPGSRPTRNSRPPARSAPPSGSQGRAAERLQDRAGVALSRPGRFPPAEISPRRRPGHPRQGRIDPGAQPRREDRRIETGRARRHRKRRQRRRRPRDRRDQCRRSTTGSRSTARWRPTGPTPWPSRSRATACPTPSTGTWPIPTTTSGSIRDRAPSTT